MPSVSAATAPGDLRGAALASWLAKHADDVPATSQEPARPRPLFYNPRSPEEGLLLQSGGDIIRFSFGRLETEDPAALAALRKGVAEGRYFEADPGMEPLVCDACRQPFKSGKAFQIHVRLCTQER